MDHTPVEKTLPRRLAWVFYAVSWLSWWKFLPAFFLRLVMEVAGKQYRSMIGLGYGIMFGVGYCITPWLAKALRSDVYFQLALTLPGMLYFSFWWWVIVKYDRLVVRCMMKYFDFWADVHWCIVATENSYTYLLVFFPVTISVVVFVAQSAAMITEELLVSPIMIPSPGSSPGSSL